MEFQVRFAIPDDAEVIGYHRARMFQDMGQIPDRLFDRFRSRSAERVREMLVSGEYVGWLATPATKPESVIAGAGVQLRRVLPHPGGGDTGFADGRQALIINVFPEPEWRRRGLPEVVVKHTHRMVG